MIRVIKKWFKCDENAAAYKVKISDQAEIITKLKNKVANLESECRVLDSELTTLEKDRDKFKKLYQDVQSLKVPVKKVRKKAVKK